MKNDIAIATLSWIRTPDESKVVLETIEYLSKLDVPLVIVDAGSPKEDGEKIKDMKNVIFFEDKNDLTSQLILSHKEAANLADSIFYLHTDKLDFARSTASKMIETYRKLDKKGMLVPVRTKKSIATYLPYQRTAEEYLNYFVGDYVGIPGDYYAGPKIYPRSLVQYLDQMNEKIGWGIEAYFYVIAKRLGLSFDFLPFFMRAPIDVDDEEKTKIYRLQIVEWQINGFIQAQKVKL